MTLSINQYDEIEREKKIDLSFSEIMAFSTTTFDLAGFPAQVSCERELIRYVDWNRDPGNQIYFRSGEFIRGAGVQTDFTPDEAKILLQVCDQTVEVTNTLGRSIRPLSNPIAQIGLFRVVMAIADICERKSLSVFEIGPGSGYLGAMLINQEFKYSSMDNAQALYLWQNRLFSHITPENNFYDLAEIKEFDENKIAPINHVPWWQYLKFAKNPPIQADIIISNANLAEMNVDALKFTLRVASKMLQQSDIKLFIFTNIGNPSQSVEEHIDQYFLDAKFEMVFNDFFYGYMPKGSRLPWKLGKLSQELPLYNPSSSDKILKAVDFMRLPHDQRPLDLDFTEILEGWTPPVSE